MEKIAISPEDLHGRLEPEANQAGEDAATCATISLAISMKRIADAMAGTSDGKNSGILHAVHDLVR